MSQEQANADDKGADGFREAQVGATFVLLQYALRGAEALGRHFDVDLEGLTNNCMEDEMLCMSYEQWVKTRMSTTMFTPGWMLVFTLGSQIMLTRNANLANKERQQQDDSTQGMSHDEYGSQQTYGESDYFVPLEDEQGSAMDDPSSEPVSPLTMIAAPREAFQPIYPPLDDPKETARVDDLIRESMSRQDNGKRRSSPTAIEKTPRKPRARKPSTKRRAPRKKKITADHFLDIMAADDGPLSSDDGDETE